MEATKVQVRNDVEGYPVIALIKDEVSHPIYNIFIRNQYEEIDTEACEFLSEPYVQIEDLTTPVEVDETIFGKLHIQALAWDDASGELIVN